VVQCFLKALVGKTKAWWEIITVLPAAAVHLLVQDTNFFVSVQFKNYGYKGLLYMTNSMA
jgi:hypothetical protein